MRVPGIEHRNPAEIKILSSLQHPTPAVFRAVSENQGDLPNATGNHRLRRCSNSLLLIRILS